MRILACLGHYQARIHLTGFGASFATHVPYITESTEACTLARGSCADAGGCRVADVAGNSRRLPGAFRGLWFRAHRRAPGVRGHDRTAPPAVELARPAAGPRR